MAHGSEWDSAGSGWRCPACGSGGAKIGGIGGHFLVHACLLPGKPARQLIIGPFTEYHIYRDRYIATGDPAYLDRMLAHVG